MEDRNYLIIIPIFIIAIIVGVFIYSNLTKQSTPVIYNEIVDDHYAALEFENNRVILEVAKSEEKKAYGLMNRRELDEDRGMFFVFDSEQYLSFYMKDTYISLDIIFLDKDFKVDTIHKNTKVLQTDELYVSEGESQYVIELNAGWADNNGLEVGDSFKFLDFSLYENGGVP